MKSSLFPQLITRLLLTALISGWLPISSVIAASPLTIDGIDINNLSSATDGARAEIKWRTNQPAYGRLRYGLKADQLTTVVNTSGNPQLSYTTTLSSLKSETTYYISVEAYINNDSVISFIRTFKTNKFTQLGLPEFKDVHLVDVTGKTATFQWQTNEDTSASLNYGTDKNKLSGSASQGNLSKQHEITIKNLKPSTTYYYRLLVKDKDNNVSTYYTDSFRTAETDNLDKQPLTIIALTPNDINSTDVTYNSIVVRLQTNRITKATVTLTKLPKGKSITVKSGDLSNTINALAFTGLDPASTYRATVEVRDVTGQSKKLENITFATKEAPITERKLGVSAGKAYYSPAFRLIKTADHDTVYALINLKTTGPVCAPRVSAASVLSQGNGWSADYFDYPESHPDMNLKGTQGSTLTPLQHDWYSQKYFVRSQVDTNLTFGANWHPLDDFNKENRDHNYFFGARWSATVVTKSAGKYDFTLASDDDTWILVNNQVVVNNSGLHGDFRKRSSIQLAAGNNQVDIYFAERHPVGSSMYFSFTDSSLQIIPATASRQKTSPAQCQPAAFDQSGVVKHAIMSPEAFIRYGYRWSDIEIVEPMELDRYPTAVVARTSDSPTVYLLDTDRRLKIAIPTETIFTSYGYKFSDVIYVVPEDLQAYFDAELVKEPGSATIYKLTDNYLHPFLSAQALLNLGYSFKQVLTINSYHLGYFLRDSDIQ